MNDSTVLQLTPRDDASEKKLNDLTTYTQKYEFIVHYYQDFPPTDGYCEVHHIVPRSMGGDNSPENLVSLPADIHYIVHFLLPFVCEENGDIEGKKKMTFAFSMFSHKSLITQECLDLVQQSQEYAKLKSAAADFSRQLQKDLYANEQYKSMMIVKHKAAQQTEEYKKKHRAGILLRTQSKVWKEHHASGQRKRFARQEERELQRQRKLGKTMSLEARKHMSESQMKRYENPLERMKGANYGKNNGMYGRRGENSIPHRMQWIKNDVTGESKYVWKSQPIPSGWVKGRIRRKPLTK